VGIQWSILEEAQRGKKPKSSKKNTLKTQEWQRSMKKKDRGAKRPAQNGNQTLKNHFFKVFL
jgi:hypothetical protein